MNRRYQAVIFDLDGVIVSTDHYHFLAWSELARQEGIEFNEQINHRLRGVSRMESLEIILEKASKRYTPVEKLELAERKNEVYRSQLGDLTAGDMLPGVAETLSALRERGYKVAIGSSSKNTPVILERIGLSGYFDAVADGNGIKHSKPDPEVFLLAAGKLGVPPAGCLVVEDAEAGVVAAKRGGMAAAAIGEARSCQEADYSLESIADLLLLL
ncbi:beta-phosphoglucomutase [Paenibacillus macerans]|uniref:beta-phosphoglucomutase n=1 Tax=Paenibacillus macerans TaxID=44252 RepID=UPI00203AF8ED|nr:beta-phosphoglucomutase [Paenibacillus macerans]MCM3699544.1 beta-phosphoglucomutase [Paenibacillus macerans]